MEWVEDVDPFHLETLTTFQKYKQAQPSEQERMRDELDETMNKVSLRTKEKASKDDKKGLYKDAKAARLSGVTERTGQQWARILMAEPKTPHPGKMSPLELVVVFAIGKQSRMYSSVQNLEQYKYSNFIVAEDLSAKA
ncbi:hypothetical protein AB4K20DRAFT_1952748 [Rhizopus microsporus]